MVMSGQSGRVMRLGLVGRARHAARGRPRDSPGNTTAQKQEGHGYIYIYIYILSLVLLSLLSL